MARGSDIACDIGKPRPADPATRVSYFPAVGAAHNAWSWRSSLLPSSPAAASACPARTTKPEPPGEPTTMSVRRLISSRAPGRRSQHRIRTICDVDAVVNLDDELSAQVAYRVAHRRGANVGRESTPRLRLRQRSHQLRACGQRGRGTDDRGTGDRDARGTDRGDRGLHRDRATFGAQRPRAPAPSPRRRLGAMPATGLDPMLPHARSPSPLGATPLELHEPSRVYDVMFADTREVGTERKSRQRVRAADGAQAGNLLQNSCGRCPCPSAPRSDSPSAVACPVRPVRATGRLQPPCIRYTVSQRRIDFRILFRMS